MIWCNHRVTTLSPTPVVLTQPGMCCNYEKSERLGQKVLSGKATIVQVPRLPRNKIQRKPSAEKRKPLSSEIRQLQCSVQA
ncbi:hypothetical protein STEG23_003752 [Scotinomys teguina]